MLVRQSCKTSRVLKKCFAWWPSSVTQRVSRSADLMVDVLVDLLLIERPRLLLQRSAKQLERPQKHLSLA